MDIENLKSKIVELAGVESNDSDVTFKLFIDKIVEHLTDDDAIKIDGLGTFNLKKEPLTRQERISESQSSKKSLIFAPEGASNDSESMFLSINLDNDSPDNSEFDEGIFSVGVDKPLVPLSATRLDIDEDSDVVRNVDEKVSILVSKSEKIQNFNMWEDYDVVSEEAPAESEEDPFSILDDELKDIISHTEIGENEGEENDEENVEEPKIDVPTEEVVEEPEEAKEDADSNDAEDPFAALGNIDFESDIEESTADESDVSFDDLQIDIDDIGEGDEPASQENKEADTPDIGIEDIDFGNELDLDGIGAEEETTSNEAEVSEKGDVESTDDEEINWNWGDELKDELSDKDDDDIDISEAPATEEKELDPEIFDKIEEEIETDESLEGSVDIEDELDISFDDDDSVDEASEDASESESEEGEKGEGEDNEEQEGEAEEADAESSDDSEDRLSKTVEYTPGDEPEKPQKAQSKKFLSGIMLYAAIGLFVIIGAAGAYILFFTGDEPIEQLPEGDQHAEQVVEDSGHEQKSIRLEPQENPVVKQTNSEEKTDEVEKPSHQNENLVTKEKESSVAQYKAPANKIEEKHNVKTENKNEIVSSSNLYRTMKNEKRLSNLVFFDGKKYNVQVSSWKRKSQAEAAATKLISLGHSAFIVEAYLSQLGGTWYRVRIGDFNTAKEAEQYRLKNKL